MGGESGSSKKIKVVDRRRFTDAGELRPGRDTNPSGASGAAVRQPPEHSRAARSEPSLGRTTSPYFIELVDLVTQQAQLFLSGAEGLPAQPAQAQRMVEYLTALETKTRGNLSVEEEQVLASVLVELRSRVARLAT